MSSILNEPVDPLSGRFWFKMRTLVNFALSLLLCAILIVLISLVLPVWVADLIAIGIVCYVFVLFLNKRPISVRCEACKKAVLTNTPWVCGFCHAKNEDTDDHPFVYRCKHCSAVPKAYKCHHVNCGQLIYFTVDQLPDNYAFCLNSRAELPPEGKHIVQQAQRQEVEHNIIMTELDTKLAAAKKQYANSQPKTEFEQKKESLDRFYAGVMAARELAAKKKAEVTETFKNNPDELADALEAIKDWLERHL